MQHKSHKISTQYPQYFKIFLEHGFPFDVTSLLHFLKIHGISPLNVSIYTAFCSK